MIAYIAIGWLLCGLLAVLLMMWALRRNFSKEINRTCFWSDMAHCFLPFIFGPLGMMAVILLVLMISIERNRP